MKIGLVSDTHGKLDPRIPVLLRGVEHILHAGDVGIHSVIDKLVSVAPVTVVIGNTDWCASYRLFERREFGGKRFLVTHRIGDPKEPLREVRQKIESEKPDVVVFGHTHVMYAERHDGILFFNPGSAGKRKAGHPLSIATMQIAGGRLSWEFIDLDRSEKRGGEKME